MTVKDENGKEYPSLEAFKAGLPTTLDTVITQHRDEASLRHATDEEIMALDGSINFNHSIKRKLGHARFIVLHFNKQGIIDSKVIVLLGSHSISISTITSPILKLDIDRGLVYTRSGSLYQFTNRAKGEPSLHEMLFICGHLFHPALARYLGVPPIFF